MHASHNPNILNVGNDSPYNSDEKPFYAVELINGDVIMVGPFDTDGERRVHQSISLEIARENQRKLTGR